MDWLAQRNILTHAIRFGRQHHARACRFKTKVKVGTVVAVAVIVALSSSIEQPPRRLSLTLFTLLLVSYFCSSCFSSLGFVRATLGKFKLTIAICTHICNVIVTIGIRILKIPRHASQKISFLLFSGQRKTLRLIQIPVNIDTWNILNLPDNLIKMNLILTRFIHRVLISIFFENQSTKMASLSRWCSRAHNKDVARYKLITR